MTNRVPASIQLPLHEAYRFYGSSRLSCAFCVLASGADLGAAVRAEGNRDLFLHLVGIEAMSGFSFQPGRWLADIAPRLLPSGLTAAVERGKAKSEERRRIEAAMPPDLRFLKGAPPRVPTIAEAARIAAARMVILCQHGLANLYPDAAAVQARFEALIAVRQSSGR